MDVPGRAERTGFLTLRVRHENMYNFAKNLDQNGLLGEKLKSKLKHGSVKNLDFRCQVSPFDNRFGDEIQAITQFGHFPLAQNDSLGQLVGPLTSQLRLVGQCRAWRQPDMRSHFTFFLPVKKM